MLLFVLLLLSAVAVIVAISDFVQSIVYCSFGFVPHRLKR